MTLYKRLKTTISLQPTKKLSSNPLECTSMILYRSYVTANGTSNATVRLEVRSNGRRSVKRAIQLGD